MVFFALFHRSLDDLAMLHVAVIRPLIFMCPGQFPVLMIVPNDLTLCFDVLIATS